MANEENNIKIVKPQPGGQELFTRSNVDVCWFGGSLAGGKLLSINELVLTPTGWKKNGELKEGDVVCTPFGKPTKILQVFPHSNKEIYTLRTADGRECMCGLEHLWEVRTTKQVSKYRKHHENRNFSVLTTQELIDGMSKGIKYYIPIPKAQEFSEKEYLIHPYVLGVMIGDGCLTDKNSGNCFIISNTENDIVEKVAKLSNSNRVRPAKTSHNKYFFCEKSVEYKKYLREVGLADYSYNKFIPQEYLWGSIEQRRQLLYGLMDTDGCVEEKNRYSFSTTSTRLKDDFVYLCRSLGYIVTVGVDNRQEKYTSKVAYDIKIQTDDIIFSSKKHLERYNHNYEKYTKNRSYGATNDHVRIESIVYKCNEDALCILVEDKDHLYIAGDFVTTHNTFGAILSMAEPLQDPNFRGVFFRRTQGEIKTAGGIVDTFKDAFGEYLHFKVSDNPRFTSPNGSYIEARQISDESPNKVTETYRGLQGDCLIFEELTGFEWYTYNYITTRARGRGKWTGKVRATLNPKRSHWTRKFLDWYINPITGYLIPERNGVVRYFYIKGKTVDSVVWGDTKEEVYRQCSVIIDRQLKHMGGNLSYKDMIKSFTFYKGSLSENKALLATNPGYIGNVAAVGEKMSQALIEGNFNVDLDEDLEIPINSTAAESVFNNDPRRNNDKWITADLADTGNDNTIILVWDGLHIFDYLIMCTSTPKMNADKLKLMAEKHNIPDSHIIFDGIRAAYINDYINEAIPFISYRPAMGKYFRAYRNLKDECYARLVEVIKREMLSFEDRIANDVYVHKNISTPISIKQEFLEECSVVRFKDLPGGKKTLLNKKEMNQMLGKGRSMDLLDPIAMRMLPFAPYEYGAELTETEVAEEQESDYYDYTEKDVFDESTWS